MPKKADRAVVFRADAPAVELRNIGFGTMRASGTYIGALLQFENPEERAGIVAEVLRDLAITPEEVADRYHAKMCDRCGCSSSPMQPCECNEPRRRSPRR